MKKSMILGLFIILFFISLTVLFINANTIAGKIGNTQRPIIEVNNFVSSDYANDEVTYGFFAIQQYSDIFESTVITAWAFCETTENNANRETTIALVDENEQAYLLKCEKTPRPYILQQYHDKQIPSEEIGINVDFSPVGMRDGTYRMHIILEENDENYGIAETEYLFVKDALGFRKVFFAIDDLPSQAPRTIPRQMIEKWRNVNIDLEVQSKAFYSLENGQDSLLYISAFARCATDFPYENKDRWISLIVTNEENSYEFGAAVLPTYYATTDVPDFLGDLETEGYYYFQSKFLGDKLAEGTYDVYLRVYENNEIYGLEKMDFSISKLNGALSFIDDEKSLARRRQRPLVEVSAFTPVDFAKDTVIYDFYDFAHDVELENTSITAWAFCDTLTNNENREAQIALVDEEQNGYLLDCRNTPRADILQRYPDNHIGGEMIGIHVDFSSAGMREGLYRMYIILRENEENYGIAETEYLFEKDEHGFRKAVYTIDQLPGQRPHIVPSKAISKWAKSNIDCEIYGTELFDMDERQDVLVFIHGVARGAAEKTPNNESRWIAVVLSDGENAYEYGAAVLPTFYVTTYIPNFLKDPDIEGNYYFQSKFYGDTFADGTYDVYLRVHENDAIYGLEKLNFRIEKSNGVLSFVE